MSQGAPRARRGPANRREQLVLQHLELARQRVADVHFDAAVVGVQRHRAGCQVFEVEDRRSAAARAARRPRVRSKRASSITASPQAVDQQVELRLRLLAPGGEQAMALLVMVGAARARRGRPGGVGRPPRTSIRGTGSARRAARRRSRPSACSRPRCSGGMVGRQNTCTAGRQRAGGGAPRRGHCEAPSRTLLRDVRDPAPPRDAAPERGLPGLVGLRRRRRARRGRPGRPCDHVASQSGRKVMYWSNRPASLASPGRSASRRRRAAGRPRGADARAMNAGRRTRRRCARSSAAGVERRLVACTSGTTRAICCHSHCAR